MLFTRFLNTEYAMRKRLELFCLFLPLLLLWPQVIQAQTASAGPSAPDDEKKSFSGAVVVRSDEDRLLVALDESDAKGRIDGRVDHLFYVSAVDFLLWPVSFRDASAEVVLRKQGIVVLLHGEKEEIRLRLFHTPEVADAKRPLYRTWRYETGVALAHYSGDRIQDLTLEDVEKREGRAIVRYAQGVSEDDSATATSVDPFFPAPAAEEGNSTPCKQVCTATCGTGTCAVSCAPGRCAKCSCIGDNPSSPACYCT